MRILLKDFQVDAVEQLVRYLRRASDEAADGDGQAVSLSSPTGSGKTVMATAAIEALLDGDGEHAPLRNLAFLWVTDQPELNEQTRRKMLVTSSILGLSELVIVDAAFDAETFRPGRVYFLNTQKLSRTASLVNGGDGRTFSIWQTIRNTVERGSGSFFVFIDEAHRGMGENRRARNEATTIIQKFIKGSEGEIPPVPLIAGISATVERFQKIIEGTARIARPVDVDPLAVQASGLLKDVITLFHPTGSGEADVTLLRAAARSWKEMEHRWNAYSSREGIPPVQPISVVQVEDGSGRQISRTPLVEAITAINHEIGPLPDVAFAHAFQEGTRVTAGEHALRYIAPSDIEDDPEIKVVFFKTSLNTGWDCPRAETMMSFRRAVDATSIAQLVGRMVRTPLARRVDADEKLNTVPLYLPHYDRDNLSRVLAQLRAPDPDALGPVSVELGRDRVTLSRAEGTNEYFSLLEQLPSYVVPRRSKSSQVRRLMKLARLLANDGIDGAAPERAKELLLDVLRAHHKRLTRTKQFRTIVDEQGIVTVRSVAWRFISGVGDTAETMQLDISHENINDIFDAAGRRLGEGLHMAWWRDRVGDSRASNNQAKLELFALCLEGGVVDALQSFAQSTTQEWLARHRHARQALSETGRHAYDEVLDLAVEPELTGLAYPDTVEMARGSTNWGKHLFVDGDRLAPIKLNTWEADVIREEIEKDAIVGWLRNVDRKPWALTVPYEFGGVMKPMFPDLLLIRHDPSGGLVVDLLDPHSISLADAPAKAAGLARYADRHAHDFGRIELIIVKDRKRRRIDLTDETERAKVRAVQTHAHLEQLYGDA